MTTAREGWETRAGESIDGGALEKAARRCVAAGRLIFGVSLVALGGGLGLASRGTPALGPSALVAFLAAFDATAVWREPLALLVAEPWLERRDLFPGGVASHTPRRWSDRGLGRRQPKHSLHGGRDCT